MTGVTLEFEKPIAELERRIEDLRKAAGDGQLSVDEEVSTLEAKLAEMRADV